MPEVSYTTEMRLPLPTVWAFVSDMNNWAPFLTGYQKHEIIDRTDSLWILKGEVGILSRIVELRAHVTEWVEPSRVSFTLTGVNEVVDGGGTLVLRHAVLAPGPSPAPRERGEEGLLTPPLPRSGRGGWGVRAWRAMLRALARFFYRLTRRSAPPAALAQPNHAGEGVELRFTLRMDAGGPAGPLVNAMLGPALEPAVEDLANKIAAHLQGWPRVEGR
jgi:carbon monoxide dehydrogenase subunit G